VASNKGLKARAWLGDEVEHEPNLPFPIVLYPKKFGFYFAFAETLESEPYFCECLREVMEAHAKTMELKTCEDYLASVLEPRVQPWEKDNFNQKMSLRIQETPPELKSEILFKQGLCHACNKIIPSLLSSAYAHASFAFERLYWYTKQIRVMQGYRPSYEGFKTFIASNPERFALAIEKAKNDHDLYQKCHRQFFSETEMETKRRFDLHTLGGSSQAEQVLLSMVNSIFPNDLVQHKVRPAWLENLELDIWIPHLRIGIEYQGEQHYKPVSHWGGQEAFEKQVERDKLKRKLCKANGVRLIEIKFSQELDVDALWILIHKKIV